MRQGSPPALASRANTPIKEVRKAREERKKREQALKRAAMVKQTGGVLRRDKKKQQQASPELRVVSHKANAKGMI